MVTLASKLPHAHEITHVGKTLIIAGNNAPDALMGFGLTQNVDEAWLDDYIAKSQSVPFTSGRIFKNDGRKIAGELKEKEGDAALLTKMEPLTPDKIKKAAPKIAEFTQKD